YQTSIHAFHHISSRHHPYFLTATAATAISTLSLHDTLPISYSAAGSLSKFSSVSLQHQWNCQPEDFCILAFFFVNQINSGSDVRSEEHTSELQSRFVLVCRLLLVNKKQPFIHPLPCTSHHET